MIRRLLTLTLLVPCLAFANGTLATDQLYRNLITSVKINDFDLMAAQYHKDAVVVSAKKNELISNAIKRWTVSGNKLYAEGGKARLAMRFKQRTINDSAAFESGIYHYQTIDRDNQVTDFYVHFEDLNVLKDGQWRVIMERNVKKATAEEFEQLPAFN